MDKVLVHLSVPAAELETDVFVPRCISVSETAGLLAQAADEMSRGFFKPTGGEVLCRRRGDIALKPDACIANCDLQNGDELVLI